MFSTKDESKTIPKELITRDMKIGNRSLKLKKILPTERELTQATSALTLFMVFALVF